MCCINENSQFESAFYQFKWYYTEPEQKTLKLRINESLEHILTQREHFLFKSRTVKQLFPVGYVQIARLAPGHE